MHDINANTLIQSICKNIGGKGGGNAYIAQCGGTITDNLDKTIELIKQALQYYLQKND
jgi:alanyl-tRNA synthetase